MADHLNRDDLDRRLSVIRGRFSGDIALFAHNLATDETVELDADALMPTASVIKLAVLVELFRRIAAGEIDPARRLPLRAEDQVGGSGILREFAPGLEPTVDDLAMLMVVLSDNTATNVLIDLVGGVAAVNETIQQRLGLRDTTLHNRIDFAAIDGKVRRLAESTPRELGRLVGSIVRGDLLDRPSCDAILDIMGRQRYLDQAPRYLAVNPYAKELGVAETLRVANKTGMFPGVRADAGVFRMPGGVEVVYCIMSEHSADHSFSPEAEGEVAAGAIGRLLVEYWWPDGPLPAAIGFPSPHL